MGRQEHHSLVSGSEALSHRLVEKKAMPQDRESGDRARRWGFSMAQKVASHLGAKLANPGRSNEADWKGRRILIKSAHYGVNQIGATPATLNRVEAIIIALQENDKGYTLYEITPAFFASRMSPSRSPRASHVMMVSCSDVRRAGKVLERI